MSLDTDDCDAMLLLSTLRKAVHTPKISHEDKQLVYTAEKLKSIRMCILMTDYRKLVQETSATDMGMINFAGLEEILLVKKAIDFFENLKSVTDNLRDGRLRGTPGHLEIQSLSSRVLIDSLNRFDIAACRESVREFLICAKSVCELRSATKVCKIEYIKFMG